MAGAAAVVFAATKLLHIEFLALHQTQDLCFDGRPLHGRRTQRQLASFAHRQDFIEYQFGTRWHVAKINFQFLAFTHPVLPVPAVVAAGVLGTLCEGALAIAKVRFL